MLWALRGGTIVAALLITAIACKSTGATILLLTGMCSLWISWRTKAKWMMWALLAAAPFFYVVRILDLWSGTQAVEIVRLLANDDRARSLEYRMLNDDLLIAKALQQPFFGWGGYGRNLVYDEDGRLVSVIDGMWMVALGNFGLVGLILMTSALLFQAILFLGRFSLQDWNRPGLAHAAVIAVIVDLSLIDGLLNGMLNVIYIIAAGGLANLISPRTGLQARPNSSATTASEHQVAQYRNLGRALKDEGRYAEARTAWSCALDLLTRRISTQPNRPTLHLQWCDCANDLAWLMVNAPDVTARDPASAVSLASRAAAAHPNCSTYWNTLGSAYYRAHEFEAAIQALDRATALADGGTAFDHFFLAMAHARLGDKPQAEQWTTLAVRWMEQHHPGHPELICLRDEARYVVSAAPDSVLAVCSSPARELLHESRLSSPSST